MRPPVTVTSRATTVPSVATRHTALLVVAVLALAVALGANTVALSVVDALWLRALPYPAPARLVMGLPSETLSALQLEDLARSTRALERVAFQSEQSRDLRVGGETLRIPVTLVSGEWFGLTGARPFLGRGVGPEDDQFGAPAVAVLSEQLWRERFGGRADVLGSTLELDGQQLTLVGVLPGAFHGPLERGAVYLPVRTGAPAVARARGAQTYVPLALIRAGVSRAAAQSELDAVLSTLRADHPREDHGIAWTLTPLRTRLSAPLGPAAAALQLAGLLLVLVAALNFGHVLLARQLARRRELAVRIALGASPSRLARRAGVEAVLLALVGGALGAPVAALVLPAVSAALSGPGEPALVVGLGGAVVGGTLVIAGLAGLLAGWGPGARIARTDVGGLVRAPGAEGRGGRARRLLLAAQVMLATGLTVSAVLLLVGWSRLLGSSPGFDAREVTVARLLLPAARYPDEASQQRVRSALVDGAARLPGVVAAGMVSELPLGGQQMGHALRIRDRPVAAGDEPSVDARVADPGYRDAIRMPLLSGRWFDGGDTDRSERVAAVNEAFARRFFPGEDARDRHVAWNGEQIAWMRIVGVVADVRDTALDRPPVPCVFVPWAQNDEVWHRWGWLVVRAAAPPTAELRGLFRSVDPLLATPEPRSMESLVHASLAGRRTLALLLGALSVLALCMTVIAVAGLFAHDVARRSGELGVRRALGASTTSLLSLVLGEGLRVLVPSALAGIAAAELAFLTGLLPDVGPARAVLAVAIGAGVVLVGLAAVSWPAWRSTRADPMEALRT